MTTSPDWQDLYALSSLDAIAERFASTREPRWLSLGRGLARRLGHADIPAADLRPEVTPEPMMPSTVMVLGATSDGVDGCIGHVSADSSGGVLSGGEIRIAGAAVHDAGRVLGSVRAVVVESLRGVDATLGLPGLELVVPHAGSGDSHGLAAALAVLHAAWGEAAVDGLGATGGFDVQSGRFVPVASATLSSKVAAARRWGLRTLVVVDGQTIPDGIELGGVEILPVSPDPAVLATAVLELARRRPGESSRSLLHRALWLYDVRAARSPGTTVEEVFETTRGFVVEDALAASTVGVPAGGDPTAWLIASDLRSRALLHAGRTSLAAEWSRVGRLGWGVDDLPSGALGDWLRYQRTAHESILEVDLARLDDQEGIEHPHARLDRAIERLDSSWCTTHEHLQRLFLANTRWRRRLHRARRELDRVGLAEAWEDLVVSRDRWAELLEGHAREGMGMADTNLARQRNYVLEHLATTLAMKEEGRSSPFRPVGVGAGPGSDWCDGLVAALLDERIRNLERLSGFDVRAVVQAIWLGWPVDESVLERIEARCATLAESRFIDAVRVADWMVRIDGAPRVVADRVLDEAVVRVRSDPMMGDVRRLVALRWAALMSWRRATPPDTAVLTELVPRPKGVESLAQAFDDLVSDPLRVVVRAPY